MSRSRVLVLLVTLSASPLAAQAPDLPVGTKVRVRVAGAEGRGIQGTVVTSADDTLSITRQDGETVRIGAGDLASVERYGRSSSSGAIRGALWGSAVGFVAAVVLYTVGPCSEGESLICGEHSRVNMSAAALAVSTGIGLLIGGMIGRESWQRVDIPAGVTIIPTPDGVRARLRIAF